MPPEGNLFLQETDLQLEQASFDLMVKADDYISIQMIFQKFHVGKLWVTIWDDILSQAAGKWSILSNSQDTSCTNV